MSNKTRIQYIQLNIVKAITRTLVREKSASRVAIGPPHAARQWESGRGGPLSTHIAVNVVISLFFLSLFPHLLLLLEEKEKKKKEKEEEKGEKE